jgi:hypothetical protein
VIVVALGDRGARSSAVVAAAAVLFAGSASTCCTTRCRSNATQMAPAQRGSSVALFAHPLHRPVRGVALAGYAAERFGTGNVIFACALGVLVLALASRRRGDATRCSQA